LKVIGLIISVLTGAFLIYASIDFPPWADPQSPASSHVSPHYIEKTMEETSVPNIVTAVLADYRGYDTMFETTVIFAAGVACFFILRIFKSKPEESEQRLYRHLPSGITIRIKKGAKDPPDLAEFERIDSNWTPHDLIIKTTCRLLIPFIQLSFYPAFCLVCYCPRPSQSGRRVSRRSYFGGQYNPAGHRL